MTRTSTDGDTNGTRGDSRPVRYRLLDKYGFPWNTTTFETRAEAARFAEKLWPDQGWDEERAGAGCWDVQAVQS